MQQLHVLKFQIYFNKSEKNFDGARFLHDTENKDLQSNSDFVCVLILFALSLCVCAVLYCALTNGAFFAIAKTREMRKNSNFFRFSIAFQVNQVNNISKEDCATGELCLKEHRAFINASIEIHLLSSVISYNI